MRQRRVRDDRRLRGRVVRARPGVRAGEVGREGGLGTDVRCGFTSDAGEEEVRDVVTGETAGGGSGEREPRQSAGALGMVFTCQHPVVEAGGRIAVLAFEARGEQGVTAAVRPAGRLREMQERAREVELRLLERGRRGIEGIREDGAARRHGAERARAVVAHAVSALGRRGLRTGPLVVIRESGPPRSAA